MHKVSIFLIALISLAACGDTKEGQKGFEAKLDSLMTLAPDFSGVVLIADMGKPVYHRAFGYKNFQTREPLDTAAVFELASLSKSFTAMLIMMLQEQGKLDFDDTLEKYVPGLPYKGITIRHLLNHTSGLPDYQAIMDKYWDKSGVAGNNDNIAYLIRYQPEKHFEPGEKYEYSNTGYMLLGTIAEKASGKSFITLCRELIFDPLEMTGAGIRSRSEKMNLTSMAWGYLYNEEQKRHIPADSFPEFNYTLWLGDRVGPGRVSATSGDLLKWDQGLRNARLVNEVTLMEAFSPARLNNSSLSYYGFGWRIERNPHLGKAVRHSGDNPGYKTHMIRYLNDEKTVILLSNNAHARFEQILKGIEDLLALRKR